MIPSLSYLLKVFAVDITISISSVAAVMILKTRDCISSGSCIASINSLFTPSSISFILCFAGIAFLHSMSKKYCCCSTKALSVLDISSGGGDDGIELAPPVYSIPSAIPKFPFISSR
jgi:hypothetical protein